MKSENGYVLLDCGAGRKLEMFESIILDRPASHVINKKEMTKEQWYQRNGIFFRNKGRPSAWYSQNDTLPDEWEMGIDGINILLKPSTNGQVGIFPEQLPNWRLLKGTVENSRKDLKILNGFSYTGIANLFALSAQTQNEVEITHVDASKSAVTWAKKNADNAGFGDKPVRWIVDDILSFMEKEKRRGNSYDVIILDPPAFGRTKDGKEWSLKRDLGHLLELTRDILSQNPELVIISCHDPEINEENLGDRLASIGLPSNGTISSEELNLTSEKGLILPSGITAKWESNN